MLGFRVLVARGDPSVADSQNRSCIANPRQRDIAAYTGCVTTLPRSAVSGDWGVSRTAFLRPRRRPARVRQHRCSLREWKLGSLRRTNTAASRLQLADDWIDLPEPLTTLLRSYLQTRSARPASAPRRPELHLAPTRSRSTARHPRQDPRHHPENRDATRHPLARLPCLRRSQDLSHSSLTERGAHVQITASGGRPFRSRRSYEAQDRYGTSAQASRLRFR